MSKILHAPLVRLCQYLHSCHTGPQPHSRGLSPLGMATPSMLRNVINSSCGSYQKDSSNPGDESSLGLSRSLHQDIVIHFHEHGQSQ